MSGTKSFSPDQVQLFVGTPPDDLVGTMTVLMKTNRYYTDGSLKQSGVSYSVTREWGKTAVESGWATDTGGVLPVQNVPSFQEGNVAALSGLANNDDVYIRWCIPGKDTSGTLFKDVSGAGNDGTIDANNTTPFAVDNRISTIVNASAGGVTLALAAGDLDFTTDSCLLAFMLTNEDPVGSEVVASWGAGTGNFPGFYFSHRSSAAGVGRVICNRGNGTVVSGSDSTVKFSNAGGTRETHVVIALDGPTGSVYLYRDGVLAASNAGLMTGANVFNPAARPLLAPRLGGNGGTSSTVAGIFRGWQGYVFAGKGLPLNIGRIAAMLAESPSVPLRDIEFQFAA